MGGTGPSDLEAAVTGQPVSVVLDAAERVFQYYNSGVLTDDACGQTGDHAVLAVGYGIEKKPEVLEAEEFVGNILGRIRLYQDCARQVSRLRGVRSSAAVFVPNRGPSQNCCLRPSAKFSL